MHRAHSLLLLLLLVWLQLAISIARTPVFAQENGEYTEAIRVGTSEFGVGNYAEARAHFVRAHGLFPTARTLRALGMVEFELKNYGECIEHLKAALDSRTRPLEPGQQRETEALLARARGYVAELNVELEPQLATVLLDGVPVKLDAAGSLVVQVGDHVLEFRAPGRLAEKRVLKVNGGEERSLHIVLLRPEAETAGSRGAPGPVAPVRNAANDAPSERRPLYRRPWLWVAVGVVVAGAAAGTAIALTRGKRHGGSMAGNSEPPTLTAP